MAETAKGGPFPEMLDGEPPVAPFHIFHLFADAPLRPCFVVVDIFVNCIYLATPIPKFLTTDFIAEAGKERRLSVVVDVSCE